VKQKVKKPEYQRPELHDLTVPVEYAHGLCDDGEGETDCYNGPGATFCTSGSGADA